MLKTLSPSHSIFDNYHREIKQLEEDIKNQELVTLRLNSFIKEMEAA